MSLYHEAECGHSVEFGRKCQQCAHAKRQAEIDRLKQAVECYQELLKEMDCECGYETGSDSTHEAVCYRCEALERGDAILKGEDAGKENGK